MSEKKISSADGKKKEKDVRISRSGRLQTQGARVVEPCGMQERQKKKTEREREAKDERDSQLNFLQV